VNSDKKKTKNIKVIGATGDRLIEYDITGTSRATQTNARTS